MLKSVSLNTRYFFTFSLLLVIVFFVSISLGSVTIPLDEVFGILTGTPSERESWNYIIQHYRLPKTITALITGSGLAVSGLMMQTLFRNPLAGPFVLGISSGASLGVAIAVMGGAVLGGFVGELLLSRWTLVMASCLGSFLVLLAVVSVSTRIKDTMAILIIGLMFGSITAAVVSVLAYFSPAEQLRQYIYWSFGSLGNNSWEGIWILLISFAAGLFLAIFSIKPLNSLLLGENYAKSQGLDIFKSRMLILIATCILAGVITAFAGPVAFIGLAVPHIVRLFFKTANHQILLPAVVLCGAILMILCDIVAQLPMTELTLPINAVTSLVGAPVVIWLLVRKKKLFF